jgi:diguanylate cyclase (GGDEF)-like protein
VTPPELTNDELTGLLGRKAFPQAFAEALEQARAGEHPLSLALFDTDHFLEVNEHYGHAAGDQVLQALAEIVRQNLPEGAIAARYGGDEFAILFRGWEREQAFLAMEKIRQAALQLTLQTVRGETIDGVRISGGVAAFPLDGRTQVELMRKADQAVYRAKMSGRNQVRLAFDERMVPKTAHFTQTQLERLAKLAGERKINEADLLREALDDLLTKYGVDEILS